MFTIVGGFATAVHYAILAALVELAGFRPLVATTIGYGVGVMVSYVLNRRYTFAAADAVATSLARYIALYVVGAVLNGAVMAGLMHYGAPYLAAQLGATSLVLVWNFAGARLFVFRDRRV